MRRLVLVIAFLVAATALRAADDARASGAADGATYEAVAAALARADQRLPGSPEYEAAIEATAKALTAAGLEVHRQTYRTMVPRTHTCRLLLGGAEVAGLHPLAPNGIALPTTWGAPVTGPLVYVGDGSLAALDGKRIEGAIAVLEFGSPNLGLVFSQGAKAVVLVGNDRATQWNVDADFTALPAQLPIAWIDRGMAEAAGLLGADGTVGGALEIAQSWEEVKATNLWCKLAGAARPAEASEGGDDQQPTPAFVLSAYLDTFGAVPDLCPQLRWAANAALLAEVMARLRGQTLERPVYAVFFGSHYGAEDGARNFYYAVGKALRINKDADTLEVREKQLCAGQIEYADTLLGQLDHLAFVADHGDDQDLLYVKAKQRLVGVVNDVNYELSRNYLDRQGIQRRLEVFAKTGVQVDAAELQAQDEQLAKRKEELDARKLALNTLRAELASKDQARLEPGFAEITDWLRKWLEARKTWFQDMLDDTRSMREIESALRPDGDAAPPETVAAHFAFDFASDQRAWMFSPFGASEWARFKDVGAGTFSRQLNAYQKVWATLPPDGGSGPLWVPDTSITFRFDALCTPHQRSAPASIPIGYGFAGFQLQTLGDPLDHDEMPTRSEVRLDRLAPRLAAFIRALSAARDLPVKTDVAPETMMTRLAVSGNGKDLTGVETVDFAKGTEDVQGPSADALLAVGQVGEGQVGAEARYLVGSCQIAFARVGPTGHSFIPGVVEGQWGSTGGQVRAWGFGPAGAIDRFVTGAIGGGSRAALNYAAGGGAFYTPFLPADYSLATIGRILIARNDTEPKHHFQCGYRGMEVFFADTHMPFKYLGNGIEMFGKPVDGKPEGEPFTAAAMLSLDPNRIAARDLKELNLQRLKLLRSRNIIDKPLEKLQADAEEHLDLAVDARAKGRTALATAHEAIADVLGNRIHQPLRDTAQDLVKAVVILLLLCLPFAFAMERLVFGFTSIYKQIAGFIGIFLATFAVLYETHPAFSLAEAPVIIFLAFIIILLSAFVIHVVMGKFRHELRAMQGLSSKAHGGGGSEGGTAFAAVAIGISGMRNRPLKTFLTAATVALLTFTILVFASFSSSLAVVPSYLGAARGEPRIEFHTPSFLALPDRLIDSIRTLYSDRYDVIVRSASFRDPLAAGHKDDVVNIAFEPSKLATQNLEAVLVVDPAEVRHLDKLFAPLAADADGAPPILLSKVVAEKLKVGTGAEIRIRGQAFRVAGTFEGSALKLVENADGTRVVPPNFDATFAANGARADSPGNMQNTFKGLDVNDFIFASPDLVAIATPAGMGKLGAQRNLIVLYPKPGANVDADAREIAEWVDGPVVASTADGVKRYFLTQAISGSGMLEVLVPLLLGGLIIFSSLLGSIVDRQKEIFTFSALGLAPPDVGALFFAESAVFAVIGGMGGYLISQVVVKLLSILSAYGIADVPDVNFSSFSSIATILIVMATVMLSTIYPALMAGRSANPGVARKWRMPKPEGDRLVFTFPFTVSAEGIGGILAFIREHFENHGDASLGAFAARDVSIVTRPRAGGGRDMGITAEIALAPFDLGVFQRFTMMTRPSDIAGIDEVVVELTRLNGAPGTWVRGNRGFIDDLREQFLRWRSLPIDSVEHYHALAEGAVGAAPAAAGAAHG